MKPHILVVAAAFLAGCTAQTSHNPSAPASVATQGAGAGAAVAAIATIPSSAPSFFAAGLRAYRSNGWDAMLDRAMADFGKELIRSVPSDIGSYCPNYPAMAPMQRAAVWQNTFIALTNYESRYDPTVLLDESTIDSTMVESNGEPIISRGLLQISMGSANGYACRITDAQQLHDPEVNLRCGVRIASRWVQRDGVVAGGSGRDGWRGLARYWSPFRREDSLRNIQQAVRSTPGC